MASLPGKHHRQERGKGPEREVEKRLLRRVSRPSRAVEDRIERAFEHRLYLLSQDTPKVEGGALRCDFHVLGNTGNAYSVKISRLPSCTCPDSGKGNICKHRLFVLLRVLKCEQSNPVLWQKALLSSELQDILGRLIPNGTNDENVGLALEEGVLADSAAREAFVRLAAGSSGSTSKQQATDSTGKHEDVGLKQRPLEGDCPVCYEQFGSGKNEAVVFCRKCGNNIHQDCFIRWKEAKGRAVTCVWCRAPWDESKRGMGREGGRMGHREGGGRTGYSSDEYDDEDGGGRGGSEYINLSQFSAEHRGNPDPDLEEIYPETHMFIGGSRKRRRF